MADAMPPDWAIEEMARRSRTGYSAERHKKNAVFTWGDIAVIEGARLIAEHEQPPVDPLYEALKAVVELGRYDTREQVELLRGQLRQRGLEIRTVQP